MPTNQITRISFETTVRERTEIPWDKAANTVSIARAIIRNYYQRPAVELFDLIEAPMSKSISRDHQNTKLSSKNGPRCWMLEWTSKKRPLGYVANHIP